MFSHLRQAVESLAPPRRSGSVDETTRTRSPEDSSTAASPVAPSISSSSSWGPLPLADSAATLGNIANLRKLPFSQRSGSPAPPSRSGTPVAGAPASEKEAPLASGRRRPNLEERLKARFAIGDSSPGDTPDASGRTTPLPPTAHPPSPTSVPLPDSPPVTPLVDPVHDADAAGRDIEDLALPPPSETADCAHSGSAAVDEMGIQNAIVQTAADVPLPLTTASEKDDPLRDIDVPVEAAPLPPSDEHEPDSTSEDPGRQFRSPEGTLAPASPQLDGIDPLHVASAITRTTSTRTSTHLATPAKGPTPAGTPMQEVPPAFDAPDTLFSSVVDRTTSAVIPAEDEPAPMVVHASAGEEADHEAPSIPTQLAGADVEALQERLKLVEQRFSDVSTSFKKLQAEKMAADKVLRELTTVSSTQDTGSLRDYLQNITLKAEMAQDEIKRLNGKLARQEERLEELRDIHRMESKSQNDLIDKLRKQLDDGQTLAKASKDAATKAEEEALKHKAELERAHADAEKALATAKEEEEKRTKAVSLLKTVRQKLVKTEKERDDALKDAGVGREKEREEREREKAERARLQGEIDRVNREREQAIAGMKAHFDREVASLKDRQEKEVAALRGQLEREAATAKSAHMKELSEKDARVSALEKSVQNLSHEKNQLFDQLQMRQAEFESSQSQLEALQSQTAELKYQLREAADRNALLADELAEARRAQDARSHGASASAQESARALALAEARFDARLAEARSRLQAAERDRNDVEANWARKLEEKAAELETLRQAMERSAKGKEEDQETVTQVQAEADRLREELRAHKEQLTVLRREANKVTEVENTVKEDIAQLTATVNALQKSLEESKGRETQLRSGNKTLREELRKVQSSAALFERQRNPGVGYFAGRGDGAADALSPRSSTDAISANGSARADSPAPVARTEEEVNLEYLRNVILQFLEHKDMRPNLVRVLSAVLRFTPQETRRLIAKV